MVACEACQHGEDYTCLYYCAADECSCDACECDFAVGCAGCLHGTGLAGCSESCEEAGCICAECGCEYYRHCRMCEHDDDYDCAVAACLCMECECGLCPECGCAREECCPERECNCSTCDCAQWHRQDPRVLTDWLDWIAEEPRSFDPETWFGSRYLLVQGLANLYLAIYLEGSKSYFRALYARRYRDALVRYFAPKLYNYIVLACVGEARYTMSQAYGNTSALSAEAYTLGVCFQEPQTPASRNDAWTEIAILRRHVPDVVLLTAARELFTDLDWPRTFGGERWADVCNVVLAYLNNETSPLVFIDSIASLQHNSGTVTDKWYRPYCGRLELDHLLNLKRIGRDYAMAEIAQRLPPDEPLRTWLQQEGILPTTEETA